MHGHIGLRQADFASMHQPNEVFITANDELRAEIINSGRGLHVIKMNDRDYEWQRWEGGTVPPGAGSANSSRGLEFTFWVMMVVEQH
jgi:hypothetical protein